MTELVIGLLVGFILALIRDDILEEYRAAKAKETPARRARAHLHQKQTRKTQKRKTR